MVKTVKYGEWFADVVGDGVIFTIFVANGSKTGRRKFEADYVTKLQATSFVQWIGENVDTELGEVLYAALAEVIAEESPKSK